MKQKDWQNLRDWEERIARDANLAVDKPVEDYWKMRAFNHELSSKRITIERILGIILFFSITVNCRKLPILMHQINLSLFDQSITN